jgi:hypothetical protein
VAPLLGSTALVKTNQKNKTNEPLTEGAAVYLICLKEEFEYLL